MLPAPPQPVTLVASAIQPVQESTLVRVDRALVEAILPSLASQRLRLLVLTRVPPAAGQTAAQFLIRICWFQPPHVPLSRLLTTIPLWSTTGWMDAQTIPQSALNTSRDSTPIPSLSRVLRRFSFLACTTSKGRTTTTVARRGPVVLLVRPDRAVMAWTWIA